MDLKILRMFNILYNSNISATNAFKFSITALLGASALLFNASAVSQDDTFSAGLNAGQHNSRSQIARNIASEKRQNAQANTEALTKAMTSYGNASKQDKANYLNQMISLAEERQALLSELVQADPASVASVAISSKERQGMPEEVQALLEQEQMLEGELEVFYEDYEDHSKSRLRHVLKTDTGRVELYTADNANIKSLQSGMKVRAKGWKFAEIEESTDSLVLVDEQNSLLVFAADGSTTTSTSTTESSTTLSNTTGEQRTLVVLVNFEDNPLQPWTVEETQDLVFGSVSDFMSENSNGQTWLTGEVIGYYTLPTLTSCDIWNIHTDAQEMIKEDGINASSYDRMVYIFPEIDCAWTGMGTVGGSPSIAAINNSFSLRTIGHEFGHNLGLRHAQQLECGENTDSGSCFAIEYGDTLDIMGKPRVVAHFNAFNKERLGWLTSSSGEIVTANNDGSYSIEPYETAYQGGIKGLKIPLGVDAETGLKQWYYLEYRQPLGFDSFLEGQNGITDGVVFHLITESDPQSKMLDMTPDSIFIDTDDAALVIGESYIDSKSGVAITTEWADSTGASVHVSFTETTCNQVNPAVSVSANQSAAVAVGSTVSYNVTVANNDSDGCDSTAYDVSATVPTGWSSTAATLDLDPGTSDTVTLTVTSAETANDGSFDITFNAINSADSSISGSAVTSYLVETPVEECVLANPSVLLSANQSGEFAAGTTVSYTATVTNNDSSSCDTATLDVVATVPDGWSTDTSTVTLEPGQSASVNLNVTSAIDAEQGVYTVVAYTYNTVDLAYNSSAESSYTVAAPELVCTQSTPGLSVSSNSGDVISGSTVTYNVTVTNQNSTDCEDKTYTVFSDVPTGWNSTTSTVSLASGQSTTVQLQVTSTSTASDGTYSIAVYAQDLADSSITSNSVVNYVIANPVNSSPVAANDTVVLSAKDVILIDVLANDSDPDGDSLTISAVTQGSKGSVEITAGGELLYTPAKNFKGSDSFSYTISDGDKTATASVSISMASSPGSDSSKGKGNNK